VALPDFFHREWPKTDHNASRGVGLTQNDLPIMQLLGSLADKESIPDLQAAIGLLEREGCTKIGIVGFCLGGRLSWLGACIGKERVHGCAMYHGGNIQKLQCIGLDVPAEMPTPYEMRSSMKCPVLGHYGGDDTNPSAADGALYKEKLAEQGLAMDVHVYEGANHGFSCPDSSNFQQAGADAAWPRTVEFFCKTLGVPTPEAMPAPPEQEDPSTPGALAECPAHAAK